MPSYPLPKARDKGLSLEIRGHPEWVMTGNIKAQTLTLLSSWDKHGQTPNRMAGVPTDFVRLAQWQDEGYRQ